MIDNGQTKFRFGGKIGHQINKHALSNVNEESHSRAGSRIGG
jgi:hypothetical protein